MEKICCISFPRSGHHLLVNMLLKYFSGKSSYPETSGETTNANCKEVIKAGKFYYCEFYNHCQKMPCDDHRTNLQKNHDLELSVKYDTSAKYIIQYRNPLESIPSFYKFALKRPIWTRFVKTIKTDSGEEWRKFAKDAIVFWKEFMRKWLAHSDKTGIYFFSYDEFLSSPMVSFTSILKYLDPKGRIDMPYLKKITDSLDIKTKNDLRGFKYYDEVFFRELETEASEEISLIGMKKYFE